MSFGEKLIESVFWLSWFALMIFFLRGCQTLNLKETCFQQTQNVECLK